MPVGSARGLETGMGFVQALPQAPLAGLEQAFIWSPASGGVTLLGQHGKAVAGSAQMLFAAESQIGLHGGTESVDVAIGVLAREHVDSFRQGIEGGVVF